MESTTSVVTQQEDEKGRAPSTYEGDIGLRGDKLDPELQDSLRQIVVQFEQEEYTNWRYQYQKFAYADFFYKGSQNLYWNFGTDSWQEPTGADYKRAGYDEGQIYHYPVNFYEAGEANSVVSLIAEGLKNSLSIREREIDVELSRMNLREVDARSEIKAELSAFYDLTGVSDPNLPYRSDTRDLFESSWDDLRRSPRNRGVTFTVSVPVWDWGVNKAEVERSKASLRSTELRQEEEHKTIERTIRDVVERVREAKRRLNVLEKSQEVAQKSFEMSLERFDNGVITSRELALERNSLTTTKTSYLNAYISYQLAVAGLKRTTLYDFENDRELVNSPPRSPSLAKQ